MKIEWNQLGEKLASASARCTRETVLVAPFMKASTLKKIVNNLSPSVPLLCLTRWRIEEIAMGVSDLECWDVVSKRSNSRLLLLPNLHTKYFRFDDVAYLGSANLTMTALGWSVRPNAEALFQFSINEVTSTKPFERNLLIGAIDVTPGLAAEFKVMLESYLTANPIAKAFSEQEIISVDSSASFEDVVWCPRSRSPEYLYRVYIGDENSMSKDGFLAAQEDLLALDLPQGLLEPVFTDLVRSRIASSPIVIRLDDFLVMRRRFGEIRSWLADQLGVGDATDDWQRLMRWLLLFLNDRYETITPGYSELFGKKAMQMKFVNAVDWRR
jgi:hypothetical protein